MGVWPRDAARRTRELVSPAAKDMMPLPRYDPCSQGDSPVLCTAEVTPAGSPLSLHLTWLVTWWVSVPLDGTDGGGASARAGAQQTGRQGARSQDAHCFV